MPKKITKLKEPKGSSINGKQPVAPAIWCRQ